jgi:Fe-Mn family superoxide dismutase
MNKHTLPDLPYAYDALAPHISAETLEYHHDKHHATYVDKLNKLIEDTAFADASLEEIIQKADGKVFNNGAQVWNHSFYWHCMAPNASAEPPEKLSHAIDDAFGNLDAFKEQFSEAATGNFGSGWTWLVLNQDGKLAIVNTSNADNPMRDGQTPLLTCDVWEHAYYIDYRNARAKYISAFWSVVNWDFVAQNLDAAPQLQKAAGM